ncbi:hypothetical protein FZEAL_1141 [Fusarium zealandicum]|uniref:Uncharacterized protein n=1 Tax=Fusarium zealandicum TaxID=1053134 RepID=A0A8H4UTX4_9HYPO|nr:hypothetical protein FZEAL_1141 [Fusarium zealandicum]
MSSNQVDRHLWLAYCKAVQNSVGGLPGHKPALFFTKKAQKAPVASPDIDPAYTNYGIDAIIDNLLQADDLFFDPSTKKTYVGGLLEYLQSVNLGGNCSPGLEMQIRMIGQDFFRILAQLSQERERALASFEEQEEMGIIDDLHFYEWSQMNAPGFINAQKKAEMMASRYQATVQQAGGPVAEQLVRDFRKIFQAQFSGVSVPGINMPACRASANVTRGLLKANKLPHGVTYVPETTHMEYSSRIEHWIEGVGDGESSIQINVADGKNVNDSDFGHTVTEGHEFTPWISFSPQKGRSEHALTLNNVDNEKKLDIQFSYDEIQSIPVHTGDWNVPSPGRLYKLKDSASQESRNLVNPCHLIIVRNLGFKISFQDGAAARQIDKHFEEAKAGGGIVRVFGIPAAPDGNIEESTEESAHVARWDPCGNVLSIKPTIDAGFASVVAIVGEPDVN